MDQHSRNWLEIQSRVFELVRSMIWQPPDHHTSPALVIRALGPELQVYFTDENPNHGRPSRLDSMPVLSCIAAKSGGGS